MTVIYTASWIQPIGSPPINDGALAVEGDVIVGVGTRSEMKERFHEAKSHHFADCVILPGLVNAHTHLELTVMRGYLEKEERDFFSWLRKLTLARAELMTPDDLYVSAAWGACEAARAGVTAVGDASDSSVTSMSALRDVGLRGVVFQESFGPDERLVQENFDRLKARVAEAAQLQTTLVKIAVSPHAPYTVCKPQLELIAGYALEKQYPLMMHAAESEAEEQFVRHGCGIFAEGLTRRGIAYQSSGLSTIGLLKSAGVLDTKPLLAHCIRVDDQDLDLIAEAGAKIAHCPKSNAKLGHGHAPFEKFLRRSIMVGFGSDSVASNNTCDILEEARFASLMARVRDAGRDLQNSLSVEEILKTATIGGATCLGNEDGTGTLRPGAQADFMVLSLAGVHQLPVFDPAATAIFSSSARDVVMTVVAGKEVYRDGLIAGVDEERLRARVKEVAAKLRV